MAVGPETGQLCILTLSLSGMIIYIVRLGDDIVVQHKLIMDDHIGRFSVVSALHTGQLLVTTRNMDLGQCLSTLVHYQEFQGSFLTNLTWDSCKSIAYRDHSWYLTTFGLTFCY